MKIKTAELQRNHLLEDTYYRNFSESIKSKRTLKTYKNALRLFLEYLKVSSLSELLATNPKLLESQIIDYIVFLRNYKKVSYSHRMISLAAIKHFCRMNDVDLPWYKISKYLGEDISVVKDRAYTIEEILQILAKADERMRVVVLLLASTGMRISAIPDLNIRSLTRIEEYSLYQIKVYEGTSDEYYCFCSRECALAIDSYLLYRSRFGEQLIPDSPLIREQFRSTDLFRIKNPRKLSYRTIGNNLDNLLIKSGVHKIVHMTEGGSLPHGAERKSVARSNGFRKFVITNMIRAKVDFVSREMLVGHNTGLDKSYYRPATEELLKEYLKVLDLVTINEENRLKITVEELTQKSRDNEYIIKAKLQEKDDQIKAITDQFSQMQQQMQSLLLSLGSMNENEKSYIAKQLFNSGIYKKDYG